MFHCRDPDAVSLADSSYETPVLSDCETPPLFRQYRQLPSPCTEQPEIPEIETECPTPPICLSENAIPVLSYTDTVRTCSNSTNTLTFPSNLKFRPPTPPIPRREGPLCDSEAAQADDYEAENACDLNGLEGEPSGEFTLKQLKRVRFSDKARKHSVDVPDSDNEADNVQDGSDDELVV